jgi:uncharacterized protein YndB with AHSA1/START domain
MPAVSLHFDVPPERVFAVLADPGADGVWVVGSREIHDADPGWPAPGTSFRHSQGKWPLTVSDTTSVIAAEPPHRLELEARVRPLLISRVVLTLEPEAGGTHVHMDEHATGGLLEPAVRLPPGPQLLQARNAEALRRLRWLAESAAVERLAT